MGAMTYGLPYTGSKNTIARAIVDQLPPAECFVDLFAGGCAVAHAAILSHKYKRIIVNDINEQYPRLFVDAIAGKHHNFRQWISRGEFHALKGSNALIAVLYSFGNDCQTYLYAAEIEPYKRALHNGVAFDNWLEFGILCPDACRPVEEAVSRCGNINATFSPALLASRRLAATRAIKALVCQTPALKDSNALLAAVIRKDGSTRAPELQHLEALQRLANLEPLCRMARLTELERLDRVIAPGGQQAAAAGVTLTVTGYDYRQLDIPAGAVVYADPPYDNARNTYTGKARDFDSATFWQWASATSANRPVYVSEYAAPPTFTPIWRAVKRVNMDRRNAASSSVESLYVANQYAANVRTSMFYHTRTFLS